MDSKKIVLSMEDLSEWLASEIKLKNMSQKRIKAKTAEQLQKESRLKLESVQQEYWRVRNEKKDYMRCPYCKDTNYPGDDPLCCDLFARAFKAVLDRQDEVDKGLAMAGQVQRMLSGYVQ